MGLTQALRPDPTADLRADNDNGFGAWARMHLVLTHGAYGLPVGAEVAAPARVVRMEVQGVGVARAALEERRGPIVARRAKASQLVNPTVARSGKE